MVVLALLASASAGAVAVAARTPLEVRRDSPPKDATRASLGATFTSAQIARHGAYRGPAYLALGLGIALGMYMKSEPKVREPAVWDRHRAAPGERKKILVVANETVAGRALRGEIVRRTKEADADVLVVCPALNSPLRYWASDEDGARTNAQDSPRSRKRVSRHAAKSVTPIRSRRWRTRSERSAPTRSSSPRTRPGAPTGSRRRSSPMRVSASTYRSRTSSWIWSRSAQKLRARSSSRWPYRSPAGPGRAFLRRSRRMRRCRRAGPRAVSGAARRSGAWAARPTASGRA